MKAAYDRIKAGEAGMAGYRPLVRRAADRGRTTRASASVALYTAQVPAFRALLDQEGGDLPRFYARVKEIAALPKPDRDDVLAQAAEGSQRSLLQAPAVSAGH